MVKHQMLHTGEKVRMLNNVAIVSFDQLVDIDMRGVIIFVDVTAYGY